MSEKEWSKAYDAKRDSAKKITDHLRDSLTGGNVTPRRDAIAETSDSSVSVLVSYFMGQILLLGFKRQATDQRESTG